MMFLVVAVAVMLSVTPATAEDVVPQCTAENGIATSDDCDDACDDIEGGGYIYHHQNPFVMDPQVMDRGSVEEGNYTACVCEKYGTCGKLEETKMLCENSPKPQWVTDKESEQQGTRFNFICEDFDSTWWYAGDDLPTVDVDDTETCQEKCSQVMKTDTGTYTEGTDKKGEPWKECICEQGMEQCTLCADSNAPDAFLGPGAGSSANGNKAKAVIVTLLGMLINTVGAFVAFSSQILKLFKCINKNDKTNGKYVEG